MSFANPTQIRLGMEGTFFSKKYRVIGRAVLSTFDFGRVYYWHEFYLETSGGSLATLVFENNDDGPMWRWFTMFEPRKPLTADEAAMKVTTDSVTIDDDTFEITRVNRSRVCYIAGRTQQGVRVGSVAHYFNARSGSQLLVVSWTGQEVEFYEGLNVSVQMVMSGFGFSGPRRFYFAALSGRSLWSYRAPILATLSCVAVIAGVIWWSDRSSPKPIQLTPPPKAALMVGESGSLEGIRYRITGDTVEEIDQVDRRFDRQEYDLMADAYGQQAELVQEQGQWLLCVPFTPQESLAPAAAGAIQTGQPVVIDGHPCTVTALFRDRINGAPEAAFPAATTLYGFTATNGSRKFTVEWDATNVLYQETTKVPQSSILAAFK